MRIRKIKLSPRDQKISASYENTWRNVHRFTKDLIIISFRAWWTLFLPFVFICIFLNFPETCETLSVVSLPTKVNSTGGPNSTDSSTTHNNQTGQISEPNKVTLSLTTKNNGKRTSRHSLWPNRTGFLPLDGTNPGMLPADEEAKRYWRNGPCTCWNTTDDGITREVECKCSGPNLTRLTTTLPSDVHRLTIEHAKDFTTLGNEDLLPYANTLGELVLTELPQFKEFKNGTFYGMRKLNTIYIHGAHSLTEISEDVFNVFLPKLKLIRITYSSLQVAPNLGKLHVTDALHMVELENSKISKLLPGCFHRLKTEHLALSYNDLREIGPNAFNGATIARLTLKGNYKLTTLHPDSFVGIESLRVLDLSETAITYLPTHGLKGLESLRLQKVLSLSVIPSIYHFQNLKEASLTWPYHCCAFEFPETHDPLAFQAYQEYVRTAVKELCDKASENVTEPTTTQTEINSSAEAHGFSKTNNQVQFRRKKKRQVVDWKPAASGTSATVTRIHRDVYHLHKIGSDFIFTAESNRKPRNRRGAVQSVGKRHGHISGHLDNGHGDIMDDEGVNDADGGVGDRQYSFETGHTIKHPYDDKNAPRGGDFDPFVFDPDQSFGSVLDPKNGLERASDISGAPWGTFGHQSESDFDEEIGIFHPSVTPSPTVFTLCGNVAVKKPPKVHCNPLPDAFNPCEDIMGSLWLRGAVWVVVALALVGNTSVLVVLLLAPGRMSVQRFLMANLSWADLCMGIYLLMVATEDLVSLGSYFNYAIDWQLGWGCQIAGFLTVFASELSVFTLAVITGERWYALTRAIHLTKRLTIGGAAQLMSVGWILSMILAGLPLIGVSSYSKTSICLPMLADSIGAVVYLAFLLLFNGLAFILVATAYYQMYRAVAGHGGGAASAPGASSADTAIAKKMALLVFTDFACWAPVAFFGLTAVGGYPLIGVTDSKILLVFFYPLNSTLNPYLYAIMTKQYRRDLLLLLSRHGMCTRRAQRYKTGAASTNNTLHTMQTVLRLGSVTETKVAQPHPHNSPNGGGRVSMGNTSSGGVIDLKTEVPLMKNNIVPPDQVPETVSSRIFDHPLLPPVMNSARGQDGAPNKSNFPLSEEENDLNGVDGRSIAETSFISVPSGVVSSGGSKGFTTGINNGNKHKKLVNQESTQTIEDDHDPDHEISENTPFCRTRDAVK